METDKENQRKKPSLSKCTYFFSRHLGGPRNSSLSGALGVVGAGLVVRGVGGLVVKFGSSSLLNGWFS